MAAPVRDHALLSDCPKAALVTSAGSVDRWPTPRFDALGAFSALLRDDAGRSRALVRVAEAIDGELTRARRSTT